MATLKLGTRGSALALAQSTAVAKSLEALHPKLSVEIVIIKTAGDRNQVTPLAGMGGKGVFVKEIEEALLEGSVDLAVHSLKDVPAVLPPGLTLAAFPRRADPRDILVTKDGRDVESLAPGSRIGTGSLRRRAQISAVRPDLHFFPQRGNVDTRLKRLVEGSFDGILLAAAGLERLGLLSRVAASPIPEDVCLPAPCQGIVGIEMREDDEEWRELVLGLTDPAAAVEACAERGFLSKLGGSCQLPAAALSRFEGGRVRIRARILSPDGTRVASAEAEGPPAEAWQIGADAARLVLSRGGAEILADLDLSGEEYGAPVDPGGETE